MKFILALALVALVQATRYSPEFIGQFKITSDQTGVLGVGNIIGIKEGKTDQDIYVQVPNIGLVHILFDGTIRDEKQVIEVHAKLTSPTSYSYELNGYILDVKIEGDKLLTHAEKPKAPSGDIIAERI